MALLLRCIAGRCGTLLGWLFLVAVKVLGGLDMQKYGMVSMLVKCNFGRKISARLQEWYMFPVSGGKDCGQTVSYRRAKRTVSGLCLRWQVLWSDSFLSQG